MTRKIGVFASFLGLLLAVLSPSAVGQQSYLSAYELSLFSNLATRDSLHDQTLAWLLASDPNMDWRKEQQLADKLHQQIGRLQEQQARMGKDFLEYVYRWVRRNYLCHYGEYYNLSATLQRGEYNCVSGTALMAYVLGKLGYEYSIKETSRHVYMIVRQEGESVLIESTDPFNGFVTGNDKIVALVQEYNAKYAVAGALAQKEGKLYAGTCRISRSIQLHQLAGLQYFNVAVQHYLENSFQDSASAAKKAAYIYSTQRTQSLLLLLAGL